MSLDEASQDAEHQVARAVRCLELVQSLRGQADPHWVDAESLEELEAAATSTIEVADQYSSSENSGHLAQLSAASDKLLRASRRLLPPDGPAVHAVQTQEVEGVRETLASLKEEIEQSTEAHHRLRDESAAEWQARLTQLEDAVGETKQALQATETEVAALLDTAREQLETGEKARNTQAEKDRKARSESFEQEVKEHRGRFKRAFEESSTASRERLEDLTTEASGMLDEIRDRRDEVENEAGAVAVSALGGRLEQTADREDRWALAWTLGAIAIALLVPVAVLVSVQVERDLRVQVVVAAVALVSASGYAARAAGRHRAQAELYRDRENRMKTLLPFTANLDPEEATALKVLAGLDVFAPMGEEQQTSDGPAPRHYIEGALRDRVKERLRRKQVSEE